MSRDMYSPTRSLSPQKRMSRSCSPTKSLASISLPQLQMPVTNTNIKVVARFRPQNQLEELKGSERVFLFEDDGDNAIITTRTQQQFAFDNVFDDSSRQEDIFNYSIKQAIDDLSQGYNGTVLCYGQTGSGKSYTIMGDLESEERQGLTPRIFERIFQIIEESPKTLEYTVGVSYMEIYNEALRDLLNPKNNNKLKIHENKVEGIFVSNLETLYVGNLSDVYTILEQGNINRSTGVTNMNEQSSRSHAIFQIRLNSKNLEDGITKSGNLFLVDLAGSEKIHKTGASGQILEEAKKINSSLSALGNVINSLTDGKSFHIPYRDSKLTRILQESLGGNSRTTLIVNCSPSSYNEQETLSTLRFATRAKQIKNSVHINSELGINELKKRYLEQASYNEEKKRRIKKLEHVNKSLEEENILLRGELEMYKKLKNPESVSTSDRNFKLNDTILDLKSTQTELIKELELKSQKMASLEVQLKSREQDLSKITSLESALSQFSEHIDQMDKQNVQLVKDIKSLQEISESKSVTIKELEKQLQEKEALMSEDSENFQNKLNHLGNRVKSTKLPSHNLTTSGLTRNFGKENQLRAKISDDVDPKQGTKSRIGLNLRIVRPMRGGQDSDD